MNGLTRSLYILSAIGLLYCLAVFAGDFYYALPSVLYYGWLELFDYDQIPAVLAGAVVSATWLALTYPFLFLGRGLTGASLGLVMIFFLFLCILTESQVLFLFWAVFFFLFVVVMKGEAKKKRREKAAVQRKPSLEAPGDAIRKAAEAARDKVIRSNRRG